MYVLIPGIVLYLSCFSLSQLTLSPTVSTGAHVGLSSKKAALAHILPLPVRAPSRVLLAELFNSFLKNELHVNTQQQDEISRCMFLLMGVLIKLYIMHELPSYFRYFDWFEIPFYDNKNKTHHHSHHI